MMKTTQQALEEIVQEDRDNYQQALEELIEVDLRFEENGGIVANYPLMK
jgi:hypothetical protein